ncbi:hypothetical protein LOTGIDRAFT_171367 [Lottia gigantea]|uniref:Peptidase M12B domain-containing protein n=1 Tax=Lottia gigantea TaxID=225164 RepID=V4B7J4_LOTGI|nr:hypothetical protein LOTGIDRAFT_171367 [Lottia gigantea]ESP03571.1 hypothetical protein LOTGIDRAFT_171367 [Lottia gigantea]
MALGVKIFLIASAAILGCTEGRKQAITEENENILIDTVLIEHDGPVSRSKRSIEMPQTMFLKMKSENTDKKLRLKRAPKVNIPTYSFDNGSVVKVDIPKYEKNAIYIDHDTGRPIMVSEKGGYYDVLGDVIVNNQIAQLKPLGRGRHNLYSSGPRKFGKDMKSSNGGANLIPEKPLRKIVRALRRKASRNRNKRQATRYIVEMLFVVDQPILNRFASRNGGDRTLGDAEMIAYYELVLRSMSARYDSISSFYPSVSFALEGSGIIFPATPTSFPFYNNNEANGLVQADEGLDDFTDWVNDNRRILPGHDHALWFSGDELATGISTSVLGIAWIGGACNNLGTGMVEDAFSGVTSSIAAHELGHGLTAYHDGSFRECSDDDYNVMAARSFIPLGAKKTNPWFFSFCSANYITYYTERRHGCLLVNNNNITEPLTSNLAGQDIDADEQCRLALSTPQSYFCRNRQKSLGFAEMCNRMYCFFPNQNQCGYIGSFDYTTCGDGQWCEKGDCVSSGSAQSTASDCPQGDSPVASCSFASCGSYSASQLTDCCATCSSEPTTIENATRIDLSINATSFFIPENLG